MFGRVFYLPPLPGLADQCSLTTFVSAHRCGTVLDFHQVPFCTLSPISDRKTNRETAASEFASGKQADPWQKGGLAAPSFFLDSVSIP